MQRFLTCFIFVSLAVSPLGADVTIVSTLAGKGGVAGMIGGNEGKTTAYIKGTKMRTEGDRHVMILDAATGQMISLDPKKKEAVIHDLTKIQASMQKAIAGEPSVQIKPNGQTKTILATACTGYDMAISVPMKMGNETLPMMMSGPIWVAKGVPGTSDYVTFYQAAAQSGLFFGNPEAARGQGGAQLKSTVEMYRTIATLGGIAYETEMALEFGGSGMMAGMMNKVGGITMITTVTSVSTEPISAEMFTIPAGYSTTNK